MIRADGEVARNKPGRPSQGGPARVLATESTFRGRRYEIHVRNPDGIERGVQSITVDGNTVTGNCIPLPAATSRGDKPIRVDVLMGQ